MRKGLETKGERSGRIKECGQEKYGQRERLKEKEERE